MINALDALPEWKDAPLSEGRQFVGGIGRRQFLKGGLFAGVLAATMTAFDFVGTRIPAYAGTPTCITSGIRIALDCNGGPGNNACDKGCVTDPQHSFYCVGNYFGSRHRTCGEERRTYDNKYVVSFRIRKGDCAGGMDGWRWELNPNTCGCSGGKVKRTSCNDGYYNLRLVGGDPNVWGPDHTSVCRYHTSCTTPLGN